MSLSDRERRVLTEIESDFAADDSLRSTRCLVVAAGIAIVLAAAAAIAVTSATALPVAAAGTLTLLAGLALGLAASAVFRRWRLLRLGVRWGPPRIPRWVPFRRPRHD